MKKIIFLAILFAIIITACQHADKPTNRLLSKDKLLSQLFTININKDTTLATANGAFINIPVGALSGSGPTVQLEIKEAYSMEQIIMAGLTTQSNGQPLSSGGMIYINAVGGQSVKITKALSIKIPTPSIDKNMQLFKGDTDANGNINWVKPDSLPPNSQTAALDNGEALFMNSCAPCHDIGHDATGPDLAHIVERTADKKLLYAYTRNNIQVMQGGGKDTSHADYTYYRCLFEKRNKSMMNLFPALTDNDLDNLYGYIENKSKIKNLPFPPDEIRPCIDSCRKYWRIKTSLENQKEKLSQEKIKMVIEKIVPPVPSADTSGTPEKISPANNHSLYYQFTIEGFGWYNIDILLKDANAVESRLAVRLTGEYKANINLYLVIPSAKVYEPGGLLKGKEDEYGFYKTDGTIPLPQNIKAWVFALGEFEDKIIFARKAFSTSVNQEFEMTLSVVTKEFFNESIKDIAAAGIQIGVKDTEHADTLRAVIRELKDVEKIKPKNCDCNCGIWSEGGIYYDFPGSPIR